MPNFANTALSDRGSVARGGFYIPKKSPLHGAGFQDMTFIRLLNLRPVLRTHSTAGINRPGEAGRRVTNAVILHILA